LSPAMLMTRAGIAKHIRVTLNRGVSGDKKALV
jgi:hypothetical protein